MVSPRQIGAGFSQVGGSIADGATLGAKATGNAISNAAKATGNAVSSAGSAVRGAFCGAANWNCGTGLRGMSEWEEFKENVEDTPIPEVQVDNLESCLSGCWHKDFWVKDPTGIAFEETREKWEVMRESESKLNGFFAPCRATNSCKVSEKLFQLRPIPCGHCCDAIPDATLIPTKLGQKAPEGAAKAALRRKKLLEWDTTRGTCGRYFQQKDAGTYKP